MPGDRPRILQVGPIPPPTDGGIAAYLDGLLRSPVADAVELLTFDVRVPRWSQRIRPLRPWTSAQFLSGLARTLDQTAPDLVHIHSSAYLSFWEKSAMARLVSRRGIPWILHLHDGYFEPFLHQLRQPLADWARSILQDASGVITVCRAWESWLGDWVAPRTLHSLPNALRLDEHCATRIPTAVPHLLFLGDLSPAKGLWDVLHVLGRMRHRGVPCKLDLVGERPRGTLLRQLEQQLDDLGIRDLVLLHGRCYGDVKRRLMARASVFVLPSHRESFCIANLEAMACGLPVVSTRTGAIPEVIRHEREGLLVTPGDRDALETAVAALLQQPHLRTRLGDAARRRAASYDWHEVGERLLEIYRSILQPQAADLVSASSVAL
jgi:glycosyltransferase involved in cell wall biosynthesis